MTEKKKQRPYELRRFGDFGLSSAVAAIDFFDIPTAQVESGRATSVCIASMLHSTLGKIPCGDRKKKKKNHKIHVQKKWSVYIEANADMQTAGVNYYFARVRFSAAVD